MALPSALSTLQDRLRPFLPGTDVGLALGMIALLAVLVVPLPSVLLDMGLAVSLTASVLVLMVAMFLQRPAGLHQLPDAAAADDAAAPVPERRHHAADPVARQRGAGGGGARGAGVRRGS